VKLQSTLLTFGFAFGTFKRWLHNFGFFQTNLKFQSCELGNGKSLKSQYCSYLVLRTSKKRQFPEWGSYYAIMHRAIQLWAGTFWTVKVRTIFFKLLSFFFNRKVSAVSRLLGIICFTKIGSFLFCAKIVELNKTR
jgi:hypothetical protein